MAGSRRRQRLTLVKRWKCPRPNGRVDKWRAYARTRKRSGQRSRKRTIGCAGRNPCQRATPDGTLTQIYNPLTDTWAYGAPLPIPVNQSTAGVLNNEVYVAGGFVYGYVQNTTTALQIYDPALNSWTGGASMPIAVGDAASAVVGGMLYVAGGWGADLEPNAELEIYDPVADSWSVGAPPPNGCQRTVRSGGGREVLPYWW